MDGEGCCVFGMVWRWYGLIGDEWLSDLLLSCFVLCCVGLDCDRCSADHGAFGELCRWIRVKRQ
jgi:hypothetical protein